MKLIKYFFIIIVNKIHLFNDFKESNILLECIKYFLVILNKAKICFKQISNQLKTYYDKNDLFITVYKLKLNNLVLIEKVRYLQ